MVPDAYLSEDTKKSAEISGDSALPHKAGTESPHSVGFDVAWHPKDQGKYAPSDPKAYDTFNMAGQSTCVSICSGVDSTMSYGIGGWVTTEVVVEVACDEVVKPNTEWLCSSVAMAPISTDEDVRKETGGKHSTVELAKNSVKSVKEVGTDGIALLLHEVKETWETNGFDPSTAMLGTCLIPVAVNDQKWPMMLLQVPCDGVLYPATGCLTIKVVDLKEVVEKTPVETQGAQLTTTIEEEARQPPAEMKVASEGYPSPMLGSYSLSHAEKPNASQYLEHMEKSRKEPVECPKDQNAQIATGFTIGGTSSVYEAGKVSGMWVTPMECEKGATISCCGPYTELGECASTAEDTAMIGGLAQEAANAAKKVGGATAGAGSSADCSGGKVEPGALKDKAQVSSYPIALMHKLEERLSRKQGTFTIEWGSYYSKQLGLGDAPPTETPLVTVFPPTVGSSGMAPVCPMGTNTSTRASSTPPHTGVKFAERTVVTPTPNAPIHPMAHLQSYATKTKSPIPPFGACSVTLTPTITVSVVSNFPTGTAPPAPIPSTETPVKTHKETDVKICLMKGKTGQTAASVVASAMTGMVSAQPALENHHHTTGGAITPTHVPATRWMGDCCKGMVRRDKSSHVLMPSMGSSGTDGMDRSMVTCCNFELAPLKRHFTATNGVTTTVSSVLHVTHQHPLSGVPPVITGLVAGTCPPGSHEYKEKGSPLHSIPGTVAPVVSAPTTTQFALIGPFAAFTVDNVGPPDPQPRKKVSLPTVVSPP